MMEGLNHLGELLLPKETFIGVSVQGYLQLKYTVHFPDGISTLPQRDTKGINS